MKTGNDKTLSNDKIHESYRLLLLFGLTVWRLFAAIAGPSFAPMWFAMDIDPIFDLISKRFALIFSTSLFFISW